MTAWALWLSVALAAGTPTKMVERVVPPGATPVRTAVAMHGLGGAPERFVLWMKGTQVPTRLLLPRGPLSVDGGHGWLAGGVRHRPTEQQLIEIRAAASPVLALLAEHTDAPVTVMGFSQGGMIGWLLALEHPELVERLLVFGSWMPMAMLPPGPPPPEAPTIHVLHGAADEAFPLPLVLERVEALRARGWTVELQVFPGAGHEVTPAMQKAALVILDTAEVDPAP